MYESKIDLSGLRYNPKKKDANISTVKSKNSNILKSEVSQPQSTWKAPDWFNDEPVFEEMIVMSEKKPRSEVPITKKTKAKSKPKFKPEPQIEEKISEDEIIHKRRLVLLLEMYFCEFPEETKTFKKINLEKKTIQELEELKKEIDFTLSNKTNIKYGVQGLSMAIQTLELLIVNFTPLNVTGLGEICKQPDVIHDMKHIVLKHTNLVNTEPEARLFLKILTASMVLHNRNSSLQNGQNIGPLAANTKNSVIGEINSEYVDI